jgi:D-xylose transport system permease protein
MTTTPETPASTPQPAEQSADTSSTAVEPIPGDPGRLGGIPMPETAPDSTFGNYVTAWAKRIRYGESGALPVVAGLIVLVVIFQVQDSLFLSAGNITNLLIQGTVFILLGMAEVWVLVLGEIDLSIGFVAGIGAVITAILVAPPNNLSWWVAVIVGLLATSAIGAVQGLLVIKIGLPSFIVTLAGLLGWEGVLIYLVNSHGTGGTISISNNVILDLVNGTLSPAAGWIVMVVAVGIFAVFTIFRDRRRHASGLVAPPLAITGLKVLVTAVAGVVLVLICNTNRSSFAVLRGVPWAVVIVTAFVVAYTFLLGRTRFGRYLYAIGGNAEAARRGGVSLGWNRFWAFTLTGFTAGAAGILYASRLGSISNNIDGGTLVLYAVAAAVIGGTSLFGGRGKMVHALLGGLVIAAIYNGLGLLGISAATQFMVTALVLLAAVSIDALARRGRGTR